ncbi:MAG: response regulator [Bdellovibrionales bacterium]|nr:response regulator [Bdellovibrionales bacterium]
MPVESNPSASILVVDDNPLITNVLTSLLQSQNYEVTCCKNGEEALTALGDSPVDVIICDVMMPVLDGYGLHEKVRAVPELSHIPFVFLTALSDEKEVLRGREAGADDYVVKPFEPRQLLSLVKGKIVRSRQLQNHSQEQNEQFRKRIIHTLSHEFRTPLVAINTGTELLIEQKSALGEDKTKSLLEAIQRGGLRLERLVNDFMLMQQIEAGVADRLFESRADKKSVSELARSFVESVESSYKEEGFTFTLADRGDAAEAKIYSPQIQDILKRFVENAVKFSGQKKRIEIEVSASPSEVMIEVRDSGIGMNTRKVWEAIEAFNQLGREKLEQQGGGLGLALADRYARINGGRIELQNRKPKGAIARLILPRVTA